MQVHNGAGSSPGLILDGMMLGIEHRRQLRPMIRQASAFCCCHAARNRPLLAEFGRACTRARRTRARARVERALSIYFPRVSR
jgi:hypothetical protein